MNINWKVRLKNKQFWVSVIPALALVVQAVAAVFGWTLDFTSLVGRLIAVADAVFALLVILGIVVDPHHRRRIRFRPGPGIWGTVAG